MDETDMYLARKEIKRRLSYGSGNETPHIVGNVTRADRPRSEHTLGPWIWGWKAAGTATVLTVEPLEENSSGIAHVYGKHEANARLIAAAPDLLETCKKALPIIESLYLDNEPGMLQLRDQIQAAIAKAEGQ